MDSPRPGVDLEKELTCSVSIPATSPPRQCGTASQVSAHANGQIANAGQPVSQICTEVLFQPLTLLDCLHTYCGSCLKDWFSWQATIAESSPNPPPPGTTVATCPSCRASVRDTRHNATVATLLDMFLTANPDKTRTDEDKAEMLEKYKQGDDVLPRIRAQEKSHEERRLEQLERQMLDQAREMSLRADLGVESPGPSHHRRRREHQIRQQDSSQSDRDSSRDSRTRDARHHSRRDGDRRQRAESNGNLRPAEESRRGRSESQHRSRDSSRTRRARPIEHQASIRSLLSSSSVDSLDMEREIEEFARQIQEEGLLEGLDLDNIDLSRNDELSKRITEAYRRRQTQRVQSKQPAKSEFGKHENFKHDKPDRSEEPTPHHGNTPGKPIRPRTADVKPAARSQTDLTLRDRNHEVERRRPSFGDRSSSMPTTTPGKQATVGLGLSFGERAATAINTAPPAELDSGTPTPTASSTRVKQRPASLVVVPQSPLPSLGAPVSPGKGCLHWFGFGYSAWHKWEKARANGHPDLERPHMLTSNRFTPPKVLPGGADGRRTLTTDDPMRRLQMGVFCSGCLAWANGCYWRCRGCTHALLPLTYVSPSGNSKFPPSPRVPDPPPSAGLYTGPDAVSMGNFKPLTFTTTCSVCQTAMASAQERLHCYTCSQPVVSVGSTVADTHLGEYEICVGCYHKLEKDGRIAADNGHLGWRRCLDGHRMVMINFQVSNGGERRQITQDLVGGWDLHMEPYKSPTPGFQVWQWRGASGITLERLVSTDVAAASPQGGSWTELFPPAGGMGMKAAAKWSWYPEAGSNDELMFPKGADIREVEDVNGEWYFGTYMGKKGLFPAPFLSSRKLFPRSALAPEVNFFPAIFKKANMSAPAVLRIGARRFATSTARRAVAAANPPSPHTLGVSKAQGVAKGLVGAIGNTPLIRLNKISEQTQCEVLGKAEFMNPGGSIKDRAALYVVLDAEERGQLRPGGTVVEGTAGNTGIGLAHVCRSKGYRLVIYMPNTQSQGKIDLLRLLGAEVYPVPAVAFDNPDNYNHQARRHAERLVREQGDGAAVWTNQFDNTANRRAHVETTGPEIWAQTRGEVDAFTCATGTAGTLAGTTRFLKDASGGRVKSFLADPPGSVLHSYIQSGGKLQERSGGSITEGIGQGRITDNLAPDLGDLDGSLHISDEKSIEMVYRCLDEEGLYLGASSALNVVAAKEVAEKLGPGHTVVTMLCDGAYRYADRLFSRKWLESKKLLDAVPESLRRYIVLP
ncbi:hypothetical protein TruAng_010982 [Truncatella angustata]|nr:hypothetical protein TruAng_010982 [Truncatella angustata]